MRDMVFLSHANPEDNEFTLWLALQLAREGYPVWCDLTKLLGGEDFWKDAEQALRERTIKFLYVLSKISNIKVGPLQELQVAQNVMREHNLHDFIIPLLIDDLSHRQINIQLARTNAIPFHLGWSKSLKILFEKLEQEKVPKSEKFTTRAVASWWRSQFSSDEGVSDQSEEYYSNWFPIRALPEKIYFHNFENVHLIRKEEQNDLPPFFQYERYLVSFARIEDFVEKDWSFNRIGKSAFFSTEEYLEGKIDKHFSDRKQARDFVSRLLNMAWQKMVELRGLQAYELANGGLCFYFTKGLLKDDKFFFKGTNGEMTFRNLVGYKNIRASGGEGKFKRFWHFGIQAKPLIYPYLAYIIKPHVLFSSDGNRIWDSKASLHKARRSQCRDWWNPDWRDRILAAMAWLTNEDGYIEIRLGSDTAIQVSNFPLVFISPVSYVDPGSITALITDEDIEEDVDEIEEKNGD